MKSIIVPLCWFLRLFSTRFLHLISYVAVAGLLSSGCASETATYIASTQWRLVFEDDFAGAAGDRPDPTVWTAETGGGGWGNDELQFYTDRSDNARLNGDGVLEIRALKEDFENREYTSARLITAGKVELKYGRVEARIKLPEGQGIWPAFWMLGGDFAEVGWPECGEVDILELRGQEPHVVLGSLHGPGYSGGASVTNDLVLGDDANCTDGFHTYAVQWDPGRITWSVDGEVFHVAHSGSLPPAGRWVFDHPFFLLLNVAVGGNFVGNPAETTPLPAVMQVDWVRIYERVR